MKILRSVFVFLVILAVAGIQPAEAQFGGLGKKLKRKVKDKVENTVEQRVEDRIDRAMDSAVNKAVDSAADDLEASIEGLLLGGEPVDVTVGDNETGDLDAPFVTYTSVARVKLLGGSGGMAGALLNRFGATRETVYTHAGFQRNDNEETSEIKDAEGRRMIHINHKEKTYSIMSVDELVAPMEALTEQGMPSMEAPGVEGAEQQVREMKVTVDRREGTQIINGAPAKRTVAVVESDYEMSGVDEETGETMSIQGKSYTVLDQWHSTELAGYNTIRAFEMKMADAIMSAFDRESLDEFAGAMKNSAPGMIDAMGEAFKELGDVEGIVVRSSLHMVQVPPDGTFDLEAVLEDSATQPTQMDPATSRAMYTFMTEIGDLTTQPIDLSLFSPPTEGYTQVESPMKQAMEMMKERQVSPGQ